MTRPHPDDGCSRFERWLTPYVDGELDAVHTIEVEEHLDECESCREQVALTRALRASLRKEASTRAPAALRERVLASLSEEREAGREGAAVAAGEATAADAQASAVTSLDPPPPQAATGPKLVKLRHVFPLAAAAMLVLVLGAVQYRQSASESGGTVSHARPGISSVPLGAATTNPGLGGDGQPLFTEGSGANDDLGSRVLASMEPLDRLIEDLLDHHAEPLPPETTDPGSLERFDRYVGVRVPKPEFKNFGGKYLGARVHPVRGHKAARTAMLQYMVRNRHRVTLYVFDPQRVPMRAKRLERRRVGRQKIYVGHLRGYSVAASARNGIGYALASDLSDDESAELVMVAAK